MEKMKLTFVNVGYGEAILAECPDPLRPCGVFVMVIDGGSGEPGEYRDRASGRIPLAEYLSARGLNHIDVMVGTHIHEDHLCGLVPLLELWPPREFWQTLPAGLHRSLRPLPPLRDANSSQRKFLQSINDYRALCAGGGRRRCADHLRRMGGPPLSGPVHPLPGALPGQGGGAGGAL